MINKLILGTAQFGLDYGINNTNGKPKDDDLDAILSSAYDNNIRFLDTAEAYGNSQNRIGNFQRDYSNNNFEIITKFSHNSIGSFDEIISEDLVALNTKSLYAYLFHNYNNLVSFKNRIGELIKLREKGLINKLGVSLYTNEEVNSVLNNYDFIELIQIPFNVFDNTNQRGDVLERMKSKNIEVHTRSVFLQGLFFKRDLPSRLVLLKPYLEILESISKENNISIADISLNYCLNQPLIDKVLVGVDTEKQLLNNINSIRKLDKKIIDEIDDRLQIKEFQLLNPSNW